MRHVTSWGTAALVCIALAGCATVTPELPAHPGDAAAPPAEGAATEAVAAAADVLETRYELVRVGDYAAACELYSPGYLESLAELANADASDCVGVHETAAAAVADYLATAEQQGRAGLTPFFYVPSGIEIDLTKITSDEPDVAIAEGGAVVSTDPREFEDGVGKTPGWLSGVNYVVRGDDGEWRLSAPGER